MQLKVLIVGAGITGCSVASILRQHVPASCNLVIQICDKARGAGGRMSTSRSSVSGCSSADLGAQYISSTPQDYSQHQSIYTDLLENKILKPLTVNIVGERPHPDGTKHFVISNGGSSLVKHVLRKSGSSVEFGARVTSLQLGDESSGGRQWFVRTENESSLHQHGFDCVVLTQPVPQILELQGDVKDILDSKPEERKSLEQVEYSSRYALSLYYDSHLSLSSPVTYFFDDPCIRYVSIDNRKRDAKDCSGDALVVHTSVPWGIKHLEKSHDQIQPLVIDHLRKLLPELPDPKEVKVQRWRYSQIFKGFPGSPGCLLAHSQPLLLLAGDAFAGSSKFDHCLHSAKAAVSTIVQTYFNAPQSSSVL